MRAGVDGELGAGADAADLGGDEDLILGRVGQIDLAHVDGERFGDDGLACFHGPSSQPPLLATAHASGLAVKECP